jgi:hypothetical protein
MIKREQLSRIHQLSCAQAYEIIKAKNADYGASEDALRNFRLVEQMNVPMEVGILTRMADKLARIGKLVTTPGGPSVKDETVDDTILDMINYAIILRAAIAERHPEEYLKKLLEVK